MGFKITSLAEDLYLRIREDFGQEQLNLARTVVRNVVCLSIITRMSGISGAQYLKRKTGVVVYQKTVESKPICVVERAGKVLSQQEDDVWGSVCFIVLSTLLRACYNLFGSLRKYPMPPTHKFLSKFDVRELVAAFDFDRFRTETLPKLHGKTNFNAIVEDWNIIEDRKMWEGDMADLYEVYDWIVRLQVQLRGMKGSGGYRIPDNIPTDIEQLPNIKNTRYVQILSDALIPAYRALFPKGQVIDDGSRKVFIADPHGCMVNEFGYQQPVVPEIDPNVKVEESGYVEREPVETASLDMVQKVVSLLGRPRQKMTTTDSEYLDHGGHPELLDAGKGGFGKAALRGMRNVAGEGEVSTCIQRLANHLSNKSPEVPMEHIMDFAAGRIAAMQGDYRAAREVDCDGKARWLLVIKNKNN